MRRFAYFKRGVIDGIPIFLGYLAVSFTFGIAAKNIGLTPFQATLMSLTNMTSAGQFASLQLIAGGASYAEMAFTQLIINLRYCLMSSSLSQKFPSALPFLHRVLVAFGNTDEVFGLSSGYYDKLSPYYCYGLMASAVPGWCLGTFLGVVSGNLLPSRLLSALSVALYGMFIAIIIPPARKSGIIAGLVAVSMTLSLIFAVTPILKAISSGFRIIILTVIISAVAALIFPIKDEEAQQ